MLYTYGHISITCVHLGVSDECYITPEGNSKGRVVLGGKSVLLSRETDKLCVTECTAEKKNDAAPAG